MSRTASSLALTLLLAAAPFSAAAQERRWEIEAYGGAVAARTASEGKQTLPPAGAPIVTSNPLFPSREVPSWFFGDGALLLNDVNEEFQGTSRITPLDSLFARVEGGRTGVAGVRLRHSGGGARSIEFSVEFLGNARVAPSDFAATVESARRTFSETFAELLRSGPFTSVVTDATAEAIGGARREIAATVALNTDVGSLGPLTPYLTFGGGIVTGTGTLPSAQVSGRYRFSVLGQVPIDESDRVSLAFERPLTFAGVAGAGLRRDLSDRWGVRVDIRAFVGPDATRVRVTAEPSITRGTPAGFVESFTNPAIQFSNDPALGRRSTLSAPALDSVTVFDGGIQVRTVITVGISRRF